MEYALPELLTRNEILNILQERQLHIKNIEDLPLEELKNIYKRFILPRAQRIPKHATATSSQSIVSTTVHNGSIDDCTEGTDNAIESPKSNLLKREHTQSVQHIDTICETLIKRIKLVYMDYEHCEQHKMACRSRQIQKNELTTDCLLSLAAKRIKIDSS